MKRLFIIILLGVCSLSQAQLTYYFSMSEGSDGNTGLTTGDPLQHMYILEAMADTCTAETNFLLKRGDRWDTTSMYFSGVDINIGNYGTGELPILTNMIPLSMSSIGGNIYRAINSNLLQRDNDLEYYRIEYWVEVDGIHATVSAYQDSATYYEATSGSTTTLGDNTKSWSTNEHVGSILYMRQKGGYNYTLNRAQITSNTSNVLTFSYGFDTDVSADPTSQPRKYKLFNNKEYLDDNYEYAHWDDTLWVYSDYGIPEVKASLNDTIVWANNGSEIHFDGIELRGSNLTGVVNDGHSLLYFDSCRVQGFGKNFLRADGYGDDFSYPYDGGYTNFHSGEVAYACGGFSFVAADSSYIDSTYFHDMGIDHIDNASIEAFEGNQCILWRNTKGRNIAVDNYFERTAMGTQQHNQSDASSENVFRYNFANDFGIIMGDAGFNYAVNDTYTSHLRNYSRNFYNNTRQQDPDITEIDVITGYFRAQYFDEDSQGMVSDSNTFVDCERALTMHCSSYHTFSYNNIVGCSELLEDPLHNGSIESGGMNCTFGAIEHNTITYNTVVVREDKNAHTTHRLSSLEWPSSYSVDYNIYSKESNTMDLYAFNENYASDYAYYTFTEFQNATSFETNSDTLDYPNDSARAFQNWSHSSHQFDLGNGIYKDITENTVSGTVTVPPMYSTVLFLINSDEDGRDDLIYMDTGLIPFYNEAAGGTVGAEIFINGAEIYKYINGSQTTIWKSD